VEDLPRHVFGLSVAANDLSQRGYDEYMAKTNPYREEVDGARVAKVHAQHRPAA